MGQESNASPHQLANVALGSDPVLRLPLILANIKRQLCPAPDIHHMLGGEGVRFPVFQIFSFSAWVEPLHPTPRRFPMRLNELREICGRQDMRPVGWVKT